MEFLKQLGIEAMNAGIHGKYMVTGKGEKIDSFSPVDAQLIGSVTATDKESFDMVIEKAAQAFKEWRLWPARNAAKLRQFGEALRHYKEPLGKLVSYEMGKAFQEGMAKCRR